MKEKYLMLGLDLETLCQDCNASVSVFFFLVLLVLKRLRCVLQGRAFRFFVVRLAFILLFLYLSPLPHTENTSLLDKVKLLVRLQIRERLASVLALVFHFHISLLTGLNNVQ